MRRESQAILSLIALGRLTPREAERLLALWSAGREEYWIVGACVVACVVQFLPAMGRVSQLFLPMQDAMAVISRWMGGVL